MSTLEFFCSRLISVTAWMAVAALVVQSLLWIVRPISPRVHRLAWACVVLSGVFFVRLPIDISEHRLERAVPKPLQVVVAPIAETSRRFELAVNEPPSIPAEHFPGAVRSPKIVAWAIRLTTSRIERRCRNRQQTPRPSFRSGRGVALPLSSGALGRRPCWV